jgi:hypothetical protein
MKHIKHNTTNRQTDRHKNESSNINKHTHHIANITIIIIIKHNTTNEQATPHNNSTHTDTHLHTHTPLTHTLTHTHSHTHSLSHTHTHLHTDTNTHTYIHTHSLTHTLTHTHTQTHRSPACQSDVSPLCSLLHSIHATRSYLSPQQLTRCTGL